MIFENTELDKKTINRLEDYGVSLSNNSLPVSKEKALVLSGEAMLEKFVKDFVNLWKNELFPNCLLRDYEDTEKEIHEWLHPDEPWDESKARQKNHNDPFDLHSNTCKEVK